MIAISLSDFLHKECKDWLSQLDLFEKELEIFRGHLDDVAERNSGDEVLKQVEHFQNRFVLEKEILDTLRHDVSVHDQAMARVLADRKILDDQDFPGNQFDMRHRMYMEDKLFRDLKHEYYNFLGRVL